MRPRVSNTQRPEALEEENSQLKRLLADALLAMRRFYLDSHDVGSLRFSGRRSKGGSK